MDNRLNNALTHQEDNTSMVREPRQGTLWYNPRDGTVYGVNDGRPARCSNDVQTAHVLFDSFGALPELARPESVEMTVSLQKALEQIRKYREGFENRHKGRR